MAKKITADDIDLLNELGVDTTPTKKQNLSAKEQRIVAGFEEVERFVEEHGREPQHGEGNDIFERLYAVRLEQIRSSKECVALLIEIDTHGLLDESKADQCVDSDASDDELLNALGVEDSEVNTDLTTLKHVRGHKTRRSAELLAHREKCKNFEEFKPIFESVKNDLVIGDRSLIKCVQKANIKKGDLLVFNGQTAYIDNVDESFIDGEGREDCRLRIIFDNGTESGMLRRSLQKRLWEDETARRIISVEQQDGLFAKEEPDEYQVAGYIYVLRSLSDETMISENREVIHKIGFTKGEVKSRIANAKKEPTYLLSDVEVVAEFKVIDINAKQVEKILHKFFSSARLDLAFKDRFGIDMRPREWFLVPLPAIKKAIQFLIDGTIGNYQYNMDEAKIVER